MRIGENQMLVLRKLKEQLENYRKGTAISPSPISNNLIEDIYFPDWDYDDFEAFIDFHQIPEYLKAKASFSILISGLLEAGFVTKCSEKNTNGCSKDHCYTITDKGAECVENMPLMNCSLCKNFTVSEGCCDTCDEYPLVRSIRGAGYCRFIDDGHVHHPVISSCELFELKNRPHS